jgi:hypothetical protein
MEPVGPSGSIHNYHHDGACRGDMDVVGPIIITTMSCRRDKA